MSVLCEQKYVWCKTCDAVLVLSLTATECHCGVPFEGGVAEWRAPGTVNFRTDALSLWPPREADLKTAARRKDAEVSPPKHIERERFDFDALANDFGS